MLSVSLGGAAGALIRMAVAFPQNFNGPAPGVMTLAFLTGGPVAIGWVTAAVSHRYGATSIAWRIFLPWLSTLIACAPVWVLNLEGWICIDMALSIALVLSSIGGLIGGAAARVDGNLPLACVLLFPVMVAPMESRLTPPSQLRTVETQIVIRATPAVIWSNIERVRAIAPDELRPTWTHALGNYAQLEAPEFSSCDSLDNPWSSRCGTLFGERLCWKLVCLYSPLPA